MEISGKTANQESTCKIDRVPDYFYIALMGITDRA